MSVCSHHLRFALEPSVTKRPAGENHRPLQQADIDHDLPRMTAGRSHCAHPHEQGTCVAHLHELCGMKPQGTGKPLCGHRPVADPPLHRLSRQPRAVWAPASTLRRVHRPCFRHSYDDRTISSTRAADPHRQVTDHPAVPVPTCCAHAPRSRRRRSGAGRWSLTPSANAPIRPCARRTVRLAAVPVRTSAGAYFRARLDHISPASRSLQ